jgi:hypothetical protein
MTAYQVSVGEAVEGRVVGRQVERESRTRRTRSRAVSRARSRRCVPYGWKRCAAADQLGRPRGSARSRRGRRGSWPMCTCTYVRSRHGVPATCVLIPGMRRAVAFQTFEISSHVRNVIVTVSRRRVGCQQVAGVTVPQRVSQQVGAEPLGGEDLELPPGRGRSARSACPARTRWWSRSGWHPVLRPARPTRGSTPGARYRCGGPVRLPRHGHPTYISGSHTYVSRSQPFPAWSDD